MGLPFSASKTGLLLACQYPFRPDVEVPEEEPSEYAERGDRVHDAIDGGAPVPPEEQGYVNAALAWEASRGIQWEREVAFYWVPRTGERGRLNTKKRDYSGAPEGAVCGTVDVLAETPDGRELDDYKTSDRGAMKARPQLLTLAIMADATTIGAVELKEDGTYAEYNREEVASWDLEEHAQAIVSALGIAESGKPEPVPGEHCSDHFCPLKGTCPAYLEAAAAVERALVPASALVRRKITDPIATEEDAAQAVLVLDLINKFWKAKGKELKAFVTAHGGEIGINEDWVYKDIGGSRGGIDGKAALELAQKLGASHDELARCTYVSTFPQFKRVRRKKCS